MYVHGLQVERDLVLMDITGRTIPRGHITVCVGRHGHWVVHRTLSRWSSMVHLLFNPSYIQLLRDNQGNLYHRLVNPWRWSQGPTHSNEEFDLYHFLRSCSYLWRYHVHCVLLKAQLGRRRRAILRKQLLHWICVILGWYHGGNVQLDLWCLCWNQRKWSCLGRCCRP